MRSSRSFAGLSTLATSTLEQVASMTQHERLQAVPAMSLAVLAACFLGACSKHAETIDQSDLRVGVIATLEGPFAAMGKDAMRGVDIAMGEHKGFSGQRKIVLFKTSSTGQPATAVAQARRLVEHDKVQLVIGPLAGGEGLAVKEYAKGQPGITFLNGTAAAQETTLVDPIPNFFRFSTDGSQWTAGLGRAAHARGIHKVVTIGEDYGFPYAQVRGFLLEYCSLGGQVAAKHWVPLGTKDFSAVIAGIPQDADGIFVALGGSHAAHFLKQYAATGDHRPIVAGTSTLDQAVLSHEGVDARRLLGTLSAGPIASSWVSPAWTRFAAAYARQFPDGFDSPSLAAYTYYVNTKAALIGLDRVAGNLGSQHKAFRAALGGLSMDSPTGPVFLNENRSGVANIFVTELARRDDGGFYRKVLTMHPAVDQDMGFPKGTFSRIGWDRPDNFPCKVLAGR